MSDNLKCGITHHFACPCREDKIRRLVIAAKDLIEALRIDRRISTSDYFERVANLQRTVQEVER
jgi:hypothetical protein